MAQAALPHAAGIPSSVASKLRGLRMKINLWLLVDGLSRVLAATALLLAVCFLLDYWLNLDFYLRLGNLVLGCAVLAYLIYRTLILPFSRRVSDDALILAVEKHYGRDLGDSLISAVQFSRMTDEIEMQGVSRELVQATINQGAETAARLPFGSLIDRRWLAANVLVLAFATAAVGLYAYGASAFRGPEFADREFTIGKQRYPVQLLAIAFDREVLLRDVPWPQDVYFTLNVGSKDGVIQFPRGDDFKLQIRVREDSKYTAEDIDELVVHFVGPAGRYSETADVVRKQPAKQQDADAPVLENSDESPAEAGSESAPPNTPDDASNQHSKEQDSGEGAADSADEPSNEDDSGEMPIDYFSLELANVLDEFEFQIEARGVRGVSRWYQVKLVDRPEVEELTLTATLPQYTGGRQIQLPPGAGPHHVLAGSSLQIDATANKPLSEAVIGVGDYRQTIDLDGQSEFSAQLSADVLKKELTSGVVTISLRDTEQLRLPNQATAGPLESKRPTKFSLRVKPDRAPDVVAKLDGISGMVTPNARIPFDCLVKDEFAITRVSLHYDWKHEENQADHGQGQRDIAAVKDKLGDRVIRFREVFDLEPLEIPTGSGLRFYIAAVDNNEITGPNEGRSTEFLLRVVSDAELREDLIRRQAEQRQDFERLYKEQQDLKTETQVLQAASRDADSLTDKQRDTLRELQKNHKLLETNIGSVSQRLESIVREMENNRLDDSESELMQKLQDNVVEPMQELARGEVDAAIRELDEVRAAADDRERRQQAIQRAIEQQQRNEEKMEGILKNMAKTEGYQEAVNLFYEILKEEERIKKLTREERQRLLEEILQGRPRPPEGEGED